MRLFRFRNKITENILAAFLYLITFPAKLIKRFFGYDSENIIIISLHKLGDTVFTVPAIKFLLQKFKKENLFIICFEETLPIYKEAFHDLSYIPFGRKFYSGSLKNKLSVRRRINSFKPGKIFDLTGSVLTAPLLFYSKTKKVRGLSEIWQKPIYDEAVPHRTIPHLMDMYLEVISCGESYTDGIKTFPVKFDASDPVIINPFAGWAAKDWGLNNFVSLAKSLSNKYDCKIVAEAGLMPNDVKIDLQNSNIKVCETGTVNELINEIKLCSVFIGNDSGPLNIASILGKPTFAIYGPTNPKFIRPYGESHWIVQRQIHCTPKGNDKYCHTLGGQVGCPSFECMKQLPFEKVEEKVNEFLKYHNAKKIV